MNSQDYRCYKNFQDQELIRMARDQDPLAFTELYCRYQKRLERFLYNRFTRLSKEDARDVVQETFLRAYKNMNQFRGQSSFYTWIIKISKNLYVDSIRKKKRQIETVSGWDIAKLASTRTHPITTIGVKRAFEALSPEKQDLVTLALLSPFRGEEIAEAHGIKRATYDTRLFYAKRQMREFLK